MLAIQRATACVVVWSGPKETWKTLWARTISVLAPGQVSLGVEHQPEPSEGAADMRWSGPRATSRMAWASSKAAPCAGDGGEVIEGLCRDSGGYVRPMDDPVPAQPS
jgi:hypothetical protein